MLEQIAKAYLAAESKGFRPRAIFLTFEDKLTFEREQMERGHPSPFTLSFSIYPKNNSPEPELLGLPIRDTADRSHVQAFGNYRLGRSKLAISGVTKQSGELNIKCDLINFYLEDVEDD